MDVEQRLEEIRQLRIGLKDLGVDPDSHGNLLAALYFADGVLALPMVYADHTADLIQEVAASQERVRQVADHVEERIDGLQELVGEVMLKHTEMLTGLAEAAQVQMQALTKLVTGKDGTHETIPGAQEEAAHTNGWRDEVSHEAPVVCEDVERSSDSLGEGS